MRKQTFVAAFAVMSLGAVQSFGGVLAPGGSGLGTSFESAFFPLPPDTEWKGELLDQRSESFEFVGEVGEGGEPAPSIAGTFTSSVYRDLGTGGLAFVYSLEAPPTGAIVDQERASIRSFENFTADVFYSRDEFAVDRSADGASLDFGFNLQGVEGDFLVRSEATAFDANGSFFLEIDFEPSGVARRDTFVAFQPAADGPGPNPIPLPPAGWAALVTMALYGAAGRLRRWHLQPRTV